MIDRSSKALTHFEKGSNSDNLQIEESRISNHWYSTHTNASGLFLCSNEAISVVKILRVCRVLRPLRAINRAKGLKVRRAVHLDAFFVHCAQQICTYWKTFVASRILLTCILSGLDFPDSLEFCAECSWTKHPPFFRLSDSN